MKKWNQSSQDALAMIQEMGSRATAARVSVLNVLLSADYALTHGEIEQALGVKDDEIERVTLYRVLKWLVNQNLAHMILARLGFGGSMPKDTFCPAMPISIVTTAARCSAWKT